MIVNKSTNINNNKKECLTMIVNDSTNINKQKRMFKQWLSTIPLISFAYIYVPKSINNISRNFNFLIFRPRDMQEYIFMFSIALEWTVNSICDNQISNWCREIFKYNTVIS